MSLNEKIAEVMQWKIEHEFVNVLLISGWTWFSLEIKIESHPEGDRIAKLLQQKMVDDGWRITIQCWKGDDGATKNIFNIFAIHERLGKIGIDKYTTTEPAAIVELFKKVYGLEV